MAQCRLTSLGDDVFSWDAAPLVGLLTYEDLEALLVFPVVIGAWLIEHHRLPAGLRSPRDLTDLLLNPPLLAEAFRECVPRMWTLVQRANEMILNSCRPKPRQTFDEIRSVELEVWQRRTTLDVFESLPRQETQSVLCHYINSWEAERQFLDDPRTRAEYDRLRDSIPDPWKLRQFVFTGSQ